MKMANLTMHVCLKRKRIILTRQLIRQLGNPSHLSFWYDEANEGLIISAASKDDLDAYEIPRYFWKYTNKSCDLSRQAFLKALQYRLGWKDGVRYSFDGDFVQTKDAPAVVFHLAEEICCNS